MKKDKEILWADVQFPRDLIDAFKKPMRTDVLPIKLGTVIELEPHYNNPEKETQCGLVVSLNQKEQELTFIPIEYYTGTYNSKILQHDSFVSDKPSLDAMHMEKPIVLHVSKAQTLKLKEGQLTDENNYLLLNRDENYPLVRGKAQAPASVTKELQSNFSEYLNFLETQRQSRPKLSDNIRESHYKSPSARLIENGIPDLEMH